MTTTRSRILTALGEMSERYPHWRFGQMVVNISVWAKDGNPKGPYDVEDDDFLTALRDHLDKLE